MLQIFQRRVVLTLLVAALLPASAAATLGDRPGIGINDDIYPDGIFAVSLFSDTPAPPDPSDTVAPSVPTGLTASAVSASRINLTWNASTDNVGVTGYRIFRGGSQIAATVSASYSNTGLSASTAYSYTVAAHDAAGNVSAQSAAASATTQAAPPPPPPGSNTVVLLAVWSNDVDQNGEKGFWMGHSAGPQSVNFRVVFKFDLSGVAANATVANAQLSFNIGYVTGLAAKTWSVGPYGGTGTADPVTDTGAVEYQRANIAAASYIAQTTQLRTTGFKTFADLGQTSHGDIQTAKASGQSFSIAVMMDNDTSFSNAFAGIDGWDQPTPPTLTLTLAHASSDTTAPSVPTGLSASAVSASQINLSWNAATDNVGVTGYRIYR
ncbi:MAG: fibronectin type III domain-containing protein, partial [Elusimicrobiota bacterium]